VTHFSSNLTARNELLPNTWDVSWTTVNFVMVQLLSCERYVEVLSAFFETRESSDP